MKIALVRRMSITSIDGVNRFIAWLAEGLHKLGHEPILLSYCIDEIPREGLEEWFKEMHGLDTKLQIEALKNKPCQDALAKALLDWYLRGSGILKRNNVDVVVVNGVVPLRFRPKIAVAHGPISEGSIWKTFVSKYLYSTYDAVVCVSRESQRIYKNITPCNTIIPLPMKLDLYKSSSERENIVVHIGTRKNPHISIKAVESLRRKGMGVELYIIGSREQRIEQLAKDKPYIHLLFSLGEKEKINILCRAKALILPSSGESFSFTTLEAMACGTPPVVSNAVPEEVVMDGVNGLRVASLNHEEYAEALEKVLRDNELWSKLSRNGLEFVKQFNYIDVARKYVNLIENYGFD